MTRYLAAFFFLGLVFSGNPVEAKRKAPEEVAPVEAAGIRYTAPNHDGRHAMVRATEIATGKQLWEKEIFSNRIWPAEEEDVQWVFIKSLRLEGDKLIVMSEHQREYSFDLVTFRIKTLNAGEDGLSPVHLVGLLVCAVLAIWLIKRRLPRHSLPA